MLTLKQALVEHHLLVLRTIGEWWELDLTGLDKLDCANAIAPVLEQLDFEQELLYLQPDEAEGMRALVTAGGRLPVATFGREYGLVRQMGPGKLEREEPWLDPASPAEALWYRGFLYRGFDESAEGLVEYYFIPAELLHRFPEYEEAGEERDTVHSSAEIPAPATTTAPTTYTVGHDTAVDDLTTILAFSQRHTLQIEKVDILIPHLLASDRDRCSLLLTLAVEMQLLREVDNGVFRPMREAVAWLQQGREAQLRALIEAWSSSGWNELRHVPQLICEGTQWENEPILPRTALLETLGDGWHDVTALIEAIKQNQPDFQRPNGDYDTWYIRDADSKEFLSGFASWDAVEGRLLRYLVNRPMLWLGLLDVAENVCRPTPRCLAWLQQQPINEIAPTLPLIVQPDATLIVPRNANRLQRFQAARFADIQPTEPEQPYRYQITPQSLHHAQTQGISPQRVLSFLQQASGNNVPLSAKRAVERWGERGTEAQVEQVVILRVRDAAILNTLRNNPKTRDLIGESLSDLVAIVRHANWEQLQAATAQLGLLAEVVGR